MSAQPQPTPEPHPMPPRFRRFDDAYNWLLDHGWRQVGDSRGSHFRLEHPAYSKALQLIYKRGATWGPYQDMQIAQHLRKLDRQARRPDSG